MFSVYPNHLLVSRRTNDVYQLWTQQFYGKDKLNNTSPILLSTLNLSQTVDLDSLNLYSDKIKNLQGRILTTATLTYIPYSISEIVVISIVTTARFDFELKCSK